MPEAGKGPKSFCPASSNGSRLSRSPLVDDPHLIDMMPELFGSPISDAGSQFTDRVRHQITRQPIHNAKVEREDRVRNISALHTKEVLRSICLTSAASQRRGAGGCLPTRDHRSWSDAVACHTPPDYPLTRLSLLIRGDQPKSMLSPYDVPNSPSPTRLAASSVLPV